MGCGYSRSSSSSASAYVYTESYDAQCIRGAEVELRQAENDVNKKYVVDADHMEELTSELNEARLDLANAYKPTMVAAATKKIAELEYELEMLSQANVMQQRLDRVAKAKVILEATKRDVQLNRERRAREEKLMTQFAIVLACAIVAVALLRALAFPT